VELTRPGPCQKTALRIEQHGTTGSLRGSLELVAIDDDGGNMGMQRRRVHGIIAEENFNPRAIMDDDFVKFEKSMESIGTVADPVSKSRGIMQAAE
jgi:hypothetical protein